MYRCIFICWYQNISFWCNIFIYFFALSPALYALIVNTNSKFIVTKTRIKKTSLNFVREIRYKDVKTIRWNGVTKTLYIRDVNGKSLGFSSTIVDYKNLYMGIYKGIKSKNDQISIKKGFELFIKRNTN